MITAQRRRELIRSARLRAGNWLLSDCDCAEMCDLTDEEDDIVRGEIRAVAERLIERGSGGEG